jgi:hypothetical protein
MEATLKQNVETCPSNHRPELFAMYPAKPKLYQGIETVLMKNQ